MINIPLSLSNIFLGRLLQENWIGCALLPEKRDICVLNFIYIIRLFYLPISKNIKTKDFCFWLNFVNMFRYYSHLFRIHSICINPCTTLVDNKNLYQIEILPLSLYSQHNSNLKLNHINEDLLKPFQNKMIKVYNKNTSQDHSKL